MPVDVTVAVQDQPIHIPRPSIVHDPLFGGDTERYLGPARRIGAGVPVILVAVKPPVDARPNLLERTRIHARPRGVIRQALLVRTDGGLDNMPVAVEPKEVKRIVVLPAIHAGQAYPRN